MAKAMILFLILAIISQAKCDLFPCPGFSNCMCRDTSEMSVFCKIYNELHILPELFQNTSSLRYLKLDNCTANVLQNNIFINVSIKALAFYCPFQKLEDNSLTDIDYLEDLLMFGTKFVEIPQAITKLRKLMRLRLTNGKLAVIGREIQNMTSLKFLYLRKNQIETIGEELSTVFMNLMHLDISENRIKFLSEKLFPHSTNIKIFRAGGNYLESTDGLPRGHDMTQLLINKNKFRSIIFNTYEELLQLDISHNRLKHLLTDLSFHNKFPRLKTLTMESCGIDVLPSRLLNTLLRLEYFHLGINKIKSIPPKFFKNLRFLSKVVLRINNIEYLEDDMFKDCQNLTHLNLVKNRLKSLGNALRGANRLKELSLSANDFEILKEDEFKFLTSLEHLKITDNYIARLEENVFRNMKNLKELILKGNRISSLNGSIRNLRSLETLSLQYNRLEELTEDDLVGLVQLKTLRLDGNNLKTVNGAFHMLSNLKDVSLRKNKLRTLGRFSFPESISDLKLTVASNRWVCDCRLLWLRDFFIKTNTRENLYCNRPVIFQTKKLLDLSVEDLVRWPYTCPPSCDCSCVDEEHGGFSVKVDCSGRNISEVPFELPEQIGELYLNDNMITTVNLTARNLTNVKSLDLERNSLSSLDFEIPKGVSTMKLAGNKFKRFYDNPPSSVFLWTLEDNPWICDCETRNFSKWILEQKHKILDINEIRCGRDSTRQSLQNKVIKDLSDSDLCPSPVNSITIASVCILLILLLGTSSSLAYSRYHYHIKVWLYSRGVTWLKEDDEDDKNKIWDAFISSADEDFLWVKDILLPELEGKYPYYAIYEPRMDMLAGELFAYEKEMEVATKSKRVIALLSKSYIKNNFLMEVFKASFATSLEEKKYRLILIIIGDLPPVSDMDQSLRAAIESTRCLRFGQKLFWEMLRFAMPNIQQRSDVYISEEDCVTHM